MSYAGQVSAARKDVDEIESQKKIRLLMLVFYVFADRFMVPTLSFELNQVLAPDPIVPSTQTPSLTPSMISLLGIPPFDW